MAIYDVVLFDLDGTLTDPKEGITKSVQYALSKYGIVEDNLDNLEKFIGPPLIDSFLDFYSFSREQAVQAVEYYREYFRKQGMFENIVYPKIPELLKRLSSLNVDRIIATSKPTVFAIQILKHFKLDNHFSSIVGSNLDGTRSSKADIIEYILSTTPNLSKKKVVMVGDRKHDIIGAQKNGIDSIGVIFGYGNLEELKIASPTYIIKTVEDLINFLCN